MLHAKIGELALENDFLGSALAKAGLPSILLAAQPYRIDRSKVQSDVASLIKALKVSA